MARYVAIETNVMCGDHEVWWQVRDMWDRQTLLGYYYEAGAKKMAAALNKAALDGTIKSDIDIAVSEYGQTSLFDGRQ